LDELAACCQPNKWKALVLVKVVCKRYLVMMHGFVMDAKYCDIVARSECQTKDWECHKELCPGKKKNQT
jgi:hypothetical protein